MKKQLLTAFLAIAALGAKAQTVINDSVFVGAGYPNQVWYSLKNDSVKTEPKNNWDLAFDLRGIMASILLNHTAKDSLYGYPKSDISGWASFDTTGWKTWTPRFNSDTSWQLGAMGRYSDPNNQYDLDWGVYDFSTHTVTGDSLYLIKLGNGSLKKLWIQSLAAGIFTFKYADVDGSNEVTHTIKKTDYPNRNLAYFSIQNGTAINREPDNTTWDLSFGQYFALDQQAGGNPNPVVTGILHNTGVMAVKVANVPNKTTYNDWYSHWVAGNFHSEINTIGYDWKSFGGTGYTIKDSVVYFVRAIDERIWKVIMTGFGGSADGKFAFSKVELGGTGVKNATGKTTTTVAVYPNPANSGNDVKVVYSLDANNNNTSLHVYDISGRVVYTANLDKAAGLHYYQLPVMNAGTYIISVETDNGRATQKLIVQ